MSQCIEADLASSAEQQGQTSGHAACGVSRILPNNILSGIHYKLSARKLTQYHQYFFVASTDNMNPAAMDMPVNVPVDDPNADTEW